MQHSHNVLRDPVVYSPKKAANMLDVKVSYIKRLLRNGTLKGGRMGKFWRIKKEDLDAFIAGLNQDDHGKTGVSEDTLSKMRYHGALKSKNAAPGSIEKMTENIGKIKAELPAQEHFEKIPSIGKLKSTVLQREERKQKLESLPNFLDALSEHAYPGVKDLVNETPDALEAKFTKEAQGSEDDQVQDEDDPLGEAGFSVETIIADPDEKQWRAMKPDSDS